MWMRTRTRTRTKIGRWVSYWWKMVSWEYSFYIRFHSSSRSPWYLHSSGPRFADSRIVRQHKFRCTAVSTTSELALLPLKNSHGTQLLAIRTCPIHTLGWHHHYSRPEAKRVKPSSKVSVESKGYRRALDLLCNFKPKYPKRPIADYCLSILLDQNSAPGDPSQSCP